MNPTGITPVADRVIVKVLEQSDETKTGLKLEREKPTAYKGVVVDCGVEVEELETEEYVYYQDGVNIKKLYIGDNIYHGIREQQIWFKFEYINEVNSLI